MGATPDEIRNDIEQTRSDIGEDVDRLADRTSPARIARRRRERVRQSMHDMRGRVMGGPRRLMGGRRRVMRGPRMERMRERRESTAERTGQVTDAAKAAPHRAVEGTQGNPFAAGFIAFGVGMLASSLIPKSRAEVDAARRMWERTDAAAAGGSTDATDAADTTGASGPDAASKVPEQSRGRH